MECHRESRHTQQWARPHSRGEFEQLDAVSELPEIEKRQTNCDCMYTPVWTMVACTRTKALSHSRAKTTPGESGIEPEPIQNQRACFLVFGNVAACYSPRHVTFAGWSVRVPRTATFTSTWGHTRAQISKTAINTAGVCAASPKQPSPHLLSSRKRVSSDPLDKQCPTKEKRDKIRLVVFLPTEPESWDNSVPPTKTLFPKTKPGQNKRNQNSNSHAC